MYSETQSPRPSRFSREKQFFRSIDESVLVRRYADQVRYVILPWSGATSSELCTSCVQEGGFEGPENGPKQRRINNRLLSYRPPHR
jgi:hypothetical protein